MMKTIVSLAVLTAVLSAGLLGRNDGRSPAHADKSTLAKSMKAKAAASGGGGKPDPTPHPLSESKKKSTAEKGTGKQ
jgi:hypothetical protein